MADFGVHPEGREMLRREGAIRPLVLLLGEGIESPAAEQAAKALMTLSASDINKVLVALHGVVQAVSFYKLHKLPYCLTDAIYIYIYMTSDAVPVDRKICWCRMLSDRLKPFLH